MGTAELLDALVGAKRQFHGDVHAAPLVVCGARRVERDAGGRGVRNDRNQLLAAHKRVTLCNVEGIEFPAVGLGTQLIAYTAGGIADDAAVWMLMASVCLHLTVR